MPMLSELIAFMVPPEDVATVFRKCCSQCGLPDGYDCLLHELSVSVEDLEKMITQAKHEAEATRKH